jgi:hypothetical protein
VQASRSSRRPRMATDAEGSDDDQPLKDVVAGLARGMRQAVVAMRSGWRADMGMDMGVGVGVGVGVGNRGGQGRLFWSAQSREGTGTGTGMGMGMGMGWYGMVWAHGKGAGLEGSRAREAAAASRVVWPCLKMEPWASVEGAEVAWLERGWSGLVWSGLVWSGKARQGKARWMQPC